MQDSLKPYLLEKSIEALRELGIEEQRRYERVSLGFPVVYEIGKLTLTGTTVNACNEGMMVESHLPPKRMLEVFGVLSEKEKYRLKIRCVQGGKTYLRDAEVRHFHLHSSGSGTCRFTVGLWMPIIED